MINYVAQIGCFAARTIKCGNSCLHKAELYTTMDGEDLIVHVHSSFNPKSGYNRDYLNMNASPNRKRYAYIEYHLDSSKQNVNSLQWVVPDVSGEFGRAFIINLMPVLQGLRLVFKEILSKEYYSTLTLWSIISEKINVNI